MDPVEVTRWTLATELLDQVLELPPAQRDTAATRLGNTHDVHDELAALLAGLQRQSALDAGLEDVLAGLPEHERPRHALRGEVYGRWTLGDEIGRGGMSVVYHAVHEGEDFTQRAALKLLSVGHLGEAFVAGFLRERQILSELQHPGIARLLDGGFTPDGAPYLVMDHVEGQRIDQWCSEQGASPRDVARLMRELCRAVAYAQRHLVVHRDINPSNVLVNRRGRPVLIDFGIAKLLDQKTGEGTVRAFTPDFAAPEQLQGGAITTATDVYAIGRLFQALLGDAPPGSDLGQVLRVATHQDPEQRYPNARLLGEDIDAWLGNRPVRARRDSLWYRCRKFSRRHWPWLAAAGAAVLVGVIGLLSTLHQASITEREVARHQAVADFMLGLFQQADLMQAGADLRVTELLNSGALRADQELDDNPEVLAPLLALIAGGQIELTRYDEAGRLLDRAASLLDGRAFSPSVHADVLLQKGRLAYELGHYSDAAASLQQAMQWLEGTPEHRERWLTAGAHRVSYLVDSEQYEAALALAERLQASLEEAPASLGTQAMVAHRRAVALEVNGELDEAFATYDHALSLQATDQPGNALGRAAILSDLGISLYFAGRFEEAEAVNREVLAIYSDRFEPPHPRITSALHNVAFSLVGQEAYAEAAGMLERSLDMSIALHGPEHIESLLEEATLGTVLARLGEWERAEAIFVHNIEVLDRVAPDQRVQRGAVRSYLGDVYLQTGRLDDSRRQYQLALTLFDELPVDHVRVIEVNERLAEIDEGMQAAGLPAGVSRPD